MIEYGREEPVLSVSRPHNRGEKEQWLSIVSRSSESKATRQQKLTALGEQSVNIKPKRLAYSLLWFFHRDRGGRLCIIC
jgi:hypothetical protein